MEYRRLGRSELKVSIISMGCWAIGDNPFWGHQEEDDAVDAINAALDGGVNFFDTAELYGSEELLGRALDGKRKEVIIATKVPPDRLKPKDLRLACEESLRRLKTDYIDVYYIHWPNWEIRLEDTISTMEALKREGKIRLIGCSNFGRRDLEDFSELSGVEVNQLPYSLIWRAIEYEIQPFCVKNNIAMTCYSPLAQGLLTGKFRSADDVPEGRARTRHFSSTRPGVRHRESGAEKETFEAIERIRRICQDIDTPMSEIALAWLLSRPGVTSVIAGARNRKQMESNIKAVDMELSRDTIELLTSAAQGLKHRLGKNPDLWESDSRIR